jgi:peptidoglycan/LPS O-acetylase OafA/YrhL
MGMVRVMLAFAVLLSHMPMASYKILSGGLAVQSFFIVSGFYMALVLDSKYRDTGLFYSNRLLRLFPTYFVMLAIGIAAVFLRANPVTSPELISSIAQNPASAITMAFTNLTLIGQELLFWFTFAPDGALVFDAHAEMSEQAAVGWQGLFVPQAWSLSMELIFYALAPFLARLKWGWLAALAAASIGLRLAGHLLDVDYLLWQGRFFPTALFMFVLGMLGYRALPLVARLPKAIGWGALALLLGYCAVFSFLPMEPLFARWVTYAIVALCVPWIFHAFKDFTLDRWIGDLSYPMYLSQLIVVGAVLMYEPPFAIWIAIGGTLAISVMVLVLIEHPLDKWRQKRLARANARSSAWTLDGEYGAARSTQ